MSAANPLLTLEHLHAFAAWLVHGPGTVRQVAGKADVALISLHPRTAELLAIGGVAVYGTSNGEPIYSAVTTGLHVPSATDVVQRQLNTLSKADRVSIAAGIMATEGKRAHRNRNGGREQGEMELPA